MLEKSSDLCKKLKANTKQFREGMTKAGFKVSGDDHPICPVMIGDAKLANSLANQILRK